jgi:hypothetical protein
MAFAVNKESGEAAISGKSVEIISPHFATLNC